MLSQEEKIIPKGQRAILQLEVPVVGILRGIDPDVFGPLMQAAFSAGLQAIEVTINTPGAEDIVATNREKVPPGKYLGMGTLRNLAEAEKAFKAGSMFFVTPNIDQEVISFAGSKGIPIIAGALTPTEVYRAWEAGADMVKVFPCRALGGPRYIKELCGPYDRVPLVAVGGVTVGNVVEYLQAGAAGVGVGISLFGQEAVASGDWYAVSRNVERFMQQCKTL